MTILEDAEALNCQLGINRGYALAAKERTVYRRNQDIILVNQKIAYGTGQLYSLSVARLIDKQDVTLTPQKQLGEINFPSLYRKTYL